MEPATLHDHTEDTLGASSDTAPTPTIDAKVTSSKEKPADYSPQKSRLGDWEWADKAAQIAEKQRRVQMERQARIQEASLTASRQAGNASYCRIHLRLS